MGEETLCRARSPFGKGDGYHQPKDELHCICWYDGDGCCACGDDPDHGPDCDCDRTEKHRSIIGSPVEVDLLQ